MPAAAVEKQPSKPVRAYRSQIAAEYLGIGYSTFWRYTKEIADFPKPVSLTPGRTGMKVWLKEELDAWLDSRVATSRTA